MAFLSFDDGGSGVTNRLTYSEQFDNAVWTKTAGVTVTPNASLAPDGTVTADSITYDGTGLTNNYRIYQTVAPPAVGAQVTTAIWLRSIGVRKGKTL